MRLLQSGRLSRLGVLVLLVVNLVPRTPSAAQVSAPDCTGGDALWAQGTGPEALVVSGSDVVISGDVRSHGGVQLSGSRIRVDGAMQYATSFIDSGDNNTYAPPVQVVPGESPLHYDIAAYRPGGAAAIAAAQAGRYFAFSQDLDISEAGVLSGLYYVDGNVTLSAANLTGTVTIVAEGTIQLSGSDHSLTAYADGLLLFAGRITPGTAVIKLAGSDSTLNGVIYAPGGTAELSGSTNALAGSVRADRIAMSGSNLRTVFDATYCPDDGAPAPPDGYQPDEVVVKLFDAGTLADVAAAYQLSPVPLDQFGARPIYLLRILDGADALDKASQLLGDARVEYAEPNYLAETPESRRGRGSWVIGGSDAEYATQWAPATIRLAEAHALAQGAGVTVAVLDTGIDPDHPVFAGRLVAGFDFVDDDNDPREAGAYPTNPGHGHGTHVAGLVALAAPQASIMPVRVLDENGRGNIWVLAEGLLFAAEQGPDGQPGTGDEAAVINLSLGTLRQTALLADLVAEATCNRDDDDDEAERCVATGGVVVIAAAGNGGDSTPQYPAAEGVAGSLAIAASTIDDQLAGFSTYGPWVQLAAPGQAILSSVPGGDYGTWSGTSMAAPLAAGVAALVRSAEPELDAVAVAARLVERASSICAAVPRRLDAAAALGLALPVAASCVAPSSHVLTLPHGALSIP